jgi:gliding motility-associated-like protein
MRKILSLLICVPIIAFAQNTFVPDDNFENYLEANGMGDGIALNNNVFTANINTVTILTIDWLNISDLTGIEDFIALTELRCHDNQITSLDLSNNPALTFLDCGRNQLTSLDVSNNFALSILWAGENQLTSLNVSQNSLLYYLNCSVNQLSSLNVCCNPMLEILYCNQNNIIDLDLSANHNLVFLTCSENPLTSLDLRNGNNINMTHVYCFPALSLSCVNVDDSTWSANNWSTFTFNFQFPPQHTFSSNCPGSSFGCSFPTNGGVISGFTYKGSYNASHYFVSNNSMSWKDADSLCIVNGGNLVIINDSIENTFVSNLDSTSNLWIGLYQNLNSNSYSESLGGWEWVDGTLLDYNTTWLGYENWDNDTNSQGNVINNCPSNSSPIPQPDNAGVTLPSEEFANIYKNCERWNDYPDGGSNCFAVLEFETVPLFCSLGCTDSLACNYNPNATIDDGSCYYSPTSISNVTACDNYTWNGTTYSQIGVGVYTYSTTASTGCDSTATLYLTIYPLPIALISGSTAICEGDITTIDFTFPNGTPPYNVNWTINGTATNIIFNNTVYSMIVSPNITTTYALVDITDANGCSAALNGSITVTVNDLPLFTISSENVGCDNQNNGNATAIITSASWPVNYAWSNGQTTQTANGLGVGTYECIVTDVNGCANIQSVSINNPYLVDSMTNNILTTNESCNGAADGSIDFTVSGGAPPYTFLWSNGQITEDLENLPTGDYWITVTDSNLCGITDSVSIGLSFNDCFFIPTAFTPNGDAIHDHWNIDGIDLFTDISVKIFNRWGQLLFESVGYAQRWDGTYEGKELPTAAYYYIITLNNGSEAYKGTVTIKR